jgi:hypothetical protein
MKMRLIDADALLKEFERRQEQQINNYCDCFLNDAHELSTEWNCVEDMVENAPTIEAEPVRHGKWSFPWTSPECSVCRKTQKWTSNFCPHCGAKMDLK